MPGVENRSLIKGVTVLELTVAVVLTSILVSIVYYTWNQINLHTTVQKRKAALHTECIRISRQITDRLRGARKVLKWDTDDISFVGASGSDTCSIAFRVPSLSVDDAPVRPQLPKTEMSLFSIENLNARDQTIPYLFRMTFQLVNSHGDTANAATSLMIRRSELSESDDFMW